MLTELLQPILLNTPKGKALCHYIIDYGIESNLLFVCFLQDTGECWTFQNSEIRIENNESIGRICPVNKMGTYTLKPESER